MSLTAVNGTENRAQLLRAPLVEQTQDVRRITRSPDAFETRDTIARGRGLQRIGDDGVGTVGTGGTVNRPTGNGNSDVVGDLVDTTRVELGGAHDVLTQEVQSPDPSPPSLPPGTLTANADGSITTPGGFTIFNDGGSQWRIKDPSGLETKIFGDPHVDEGNDGSVDWHFNVDGTFILPDGTKIFCDTDPAAEGITVSSKLAIQYGDSLGQMDVRAGGPGTVGEGGLAFDSANPDGQMYVMGTDGKFYDGETLGKLYDAGGDFARDVDGNTMGHISEEALISLNAGLKEQGLELKNENPLGGLAEGDHLDPTADQLAALLALDDNAYLVNDEDGEVTAAAAARRRIATANILGQANQAVDGFTSLADLDANGDGVVSGAELDDVKVWIDANNDGNAEASEIKLLAEFNINALKVKIEIGQTDDGHTQMNGQFQRDGRVHTTNDRLTPLNDGAQGTNFQRQLDTMVGEDRIARSTARLQINRTLDRLGDLGEIRNVERRTNDLRRQANNRQMTLNGNRA